MRREARRQMFLQVDIYPVTCEELSEGRSNLEVLEAVIRGGAKIIQLREKEYQKKALYHLALKFREMTAKDGVLLIINDHVDIALAVGADGVHLGQEDLPVQVATKLAPELLIGASTHSTKEGVESSLGPEAIARISPQIKVPFTVMGGVNEANIDQVLAQGARRVAMVTGITRAADIAAKVRSLREKIIEFSST
jgi:thiamine-phosphate pyrophosphorylase